MNPQQPYPQQHSDGYQQPYQRPAPHYVGAPHGQQYPPPPPAPKRRRIWPWVLLVIVLVPILVVVSCSALFVGGVTAVQDQRAGGTLPIGQTFTYRDGTALTVADVKAYKASTLTAWPRMRLPTRARSPS